MITIREVSEYIFYAGLVFTVEWYFDEKGQLAARVYYERLSAEERERFHYMVKYIADAPIGTRLPKTLYNLEDSENKIYAFKPKDHRFFNFMTEGRKIIIVAGYRKHSYQMTKKDLGLLKIAVNRKNDYLSRVKEGTYYERFA